MARRKILEVIPRKIEKEDRKPKKRKPSEKRIRRKIEQIPGEKDYKWCEGAELPVITVVFKKGKIIEERTNDEIVMVGE